MHISGSQSVLLGGRCAQAGLLELDIAEGARDGQAGAAAAVIITAARNDPPAALPLHAPASAQHPPPLPHQAWLVICATWHHSLSRFHLSQQRRADQTSDSDRQSQQTATHSQLPKKFDFFGLKMGVLITAYEVPVSWSSPHVSLKQACK